MIGIEQILSIGETIIDRVIPDKKAAQEAKLKLLEQQQVGEFKNLEVRMSAILAEANSQDPWTSRARPTFLYVMYILLLFAIPFGFLYAYDAAYADNVVTGIERFFKAIPTELYALMGAGYLGYTHKRTKEKEMYFMGKK